MYNYPTLIEPTKKRTPTQQVIFKVVAQDNSTAVPLHEGTYQDCVEWRDLHCATYL